MSCVECGTEMVAAVENYHYKEVGLSFVTLVNVTVNRCPNCGNDEVSIPAISRLHKLIAKSVILKEARLVAEEIRFLRKHMGFSQADLGELLGVTIETVSRWENGRVTMPKTAELFLRREAATREPIEAYEKERKSIAVKKAEFARLFLRCSNDEWLPAAA